MGYEIHQKGMGEKARRELMQGWELIICIKCCQDLSEKGIDR